MPPMLPPHPLLKLKQEGISGDVAGDWLADRFLNDRYKIAVPRYARGDPFAISSIARRTMRVIRVMLS
jgi:hypothetical protein